MIARVGRLMARIVSGSVWAGPGGAADAFLQEDGVYGFLLEDGVSYLLME